MVAIGLSRQRRMARRGPARRRGAVTLELLLMLPVWVTAVLAVIEFGLLMANRQQVALASRVGAEEASITGGLALTGDGDPVPPNVMQAIQQQLQSAGITQCTVLLEHNLAGTGPPPVALSSGTCDCPAPPQGNLPLHGNYVRVTVYVPVTELAPNLLKAFGLDLSGRILRHATTFRHEF